MKLALVAVGAAALVLSLRALQVAPERRVERAPALEQRPAATAGAPGAQLERPPQPERLAPAAQELERRVEAAIARALERAAARSGGAARAGNCVVAVLALDRASGENLVSIQADRPLRPASNMKLVTSAAALVLLGAEWSFETRFELAGELTGGRLRGDLVVRAGGDPFWIQDSEGRVEELVVEPVARALAQRGVRAIDGSVVLDEGSYLEPGPGPGWPAASSHWEKSCARAGGFSVNGGLLTAVVRPGPAGSPAQLAVHPAPHGLAQRYGVDSVAGAVNDVRVGATISAVTVAGRYGSGLKTLVSSFSHPDPVQHFGAVLAGGLEARGIPVRDGLRRRRGVAPGVALCALHSPLIETLVPINTHSNNGVADQVFFALGDALGGGGTRSGGARATALALERLGLSSEGLVQVDGSGLSREDRVTARQIAALIDAVLGLDAATATAFRDSLARPGEPGTLSERMGGTVAIGRVRAKTGWIRGTSALSGLTRTLDGRELVFSILIGYPPEVPNLNSAVFKPMGDEIAAMLTEFQL